MQNTTPNQKENTTTHHWDSFYSKPDPYGWLGRYNERMRAKIVNHFIKWSYFENALDMGCGEGALTYAISDHVKKIDAFDISHNAIKFANKLHHKPNINYYQFDITNFEANDNQYDLIICTGVIEYVEKSQVENILNEIKKSITPSGYFMLSTRADSFKDRKIDQNMDPRFRPTIRSMLKILEKDFRVLLVMPLYPNKFLHKIIKGLFSIFSPIFDKYYCAWLATLNPEDSFHCLFLCIPKK
jgi:ubiquinone/menaquinone biosynthesis C-methylase UbiE